MPTIKDVVELLLEMDADIIQWLKINLETAVNMVDIVLDSDDDFVMWDIQGGMAFAIARGIDAHATVTQYRDAKYVLRAYRLDGEETIRFLPYLNKRGHLEWISEDADLMEDSPWKRF